MSKSDMVPSSFPCADDDCDSDVDFDEFGFLYQKLKTIWSTKAENLEAYEKKQDDLLKLKADAEKVHHEASAAEGKTSNQGWEKARLALKVVGGSLTVAGVAIEGYRVYSAVDARSQHDTAVQYCQNRVNNRQTLSTELGSLDAKATATPEMVQRCAVDGKWQNSKQEYTNGQLKKRMDALADGRAKRIAKMNEDRAEVSCADNAAVICSILGASLAVGQFAFALIAHNELLENIGKWDERLGVIAKDMAVQQEELNTLMVQLLKIGMCATRDDLTQFIVRLQKITLEFLNLQIKANEVKHEIQRNMDVCSQQRFNAAWQAGGSGVSVVSSTVTALAGGGRWTDVAIAGLQGVCLAAHIGIGVLAHIDLAKLRELEAKADKLVNDLKTNIDRCTALATVKVSYEEAVQARRKARQARQKAAVSGA